MATKVYDSRPLDKLDATAAPGVTNDVDEGYSPGSHWIDVTNDKAYICTDNTDGAAVWTETTGLTTSQFHVHRNGVSQETISIDTWTKVLWTTEVYDTNGDFDSTTNYRFTPTIAGKYIFTCHLRSITNIDETRSFDVALYMNGASVETRHTTVANTTNLDQTTLSVQAGANGSTDYFEIYIKHGHTATIDLHGSAVFTSWQGALIK